MSPVFPGHPEGKPCPSIDDYVEWLWGYIHQHRVHLEKPKEVNQAIEDFLDRLN